VAVADINDRLERLSRRDELARRARERAVPPSVAGVGGDFMEAVEAVAAVVRRHPGMSVMLAPGDGRQRSSVIRVTERRGEAVVAPVIMADPEFEPPERPDFGPPGYPEPARGPDFDAPTDLSHPGRSRPAAVSVGPVQSGAVPLDTIPIDAIPIDSGYGGPASSRGPEQPPPWRPPAPEPVRPQPAPYESAPAEGWSWER
jgi:hypothetical protein